MVRRTNPEDDDWSNVKDAKKRKQIQDRLAQRARRQRLREAKVGSTNLLHIATKAHARKECDCDTSTDLSARTTLPDTLDCSVSSGTELMIFDSIDPALDFLDLDLLDSVLDFNAMKSPPETPPHQRLVPLPLPSPSSSLAPALTVFSAMYLNGTILGLSCSICTTSCSPFPSPSHPLPLHPTELQLTVPHPRWFDRFPNSRWRDSLIRALGVIDEEDLLKDLFTQPSWTIETGGRKGANWESAAWESAAWDPKAWKMEDSFRAKWGWLMT